MTLHEKVYQTIKSSLTKSLLPFLTKPTLDMLSATQTKPKGPYPYFNKLFEIGKKMLQDQQNIPPDLKNASSQDILAYIACLLNPRPTTRDLVSDKEFIELIEPIFFTYPVSEEDEITWELRINETVFEIKSQEDPSSDPSLIFDRLFKYLTKEYQFMTDEIFVNILLGMAQIFQSEIIKLINGETIDVFLHKHQHAIHDKLTVDKQLKLRSLLDSIKIGVVDPRVYITCNSHEISVKVEYSLYLKIGDNEIACFATNTMLHNTLRLTPGSLNNPDGLKIEEFYNIGYDNPPIKAQGVDKIENKLMVCYQTILENFDNTSVIKNFEEIMVSEFEKKLCEITKQVSKKGGRGIKKKAAFCKKKWTFRHKGKKIYNLKRSRRNKTRTNK
jgi:hypothetical protein